MTSDTSYRIDTERFAHETVDGEVIVIDMDEGNYYSMRDSAAQVWQLAEQGHSAAVIVAALESSTGAARTEIEDGVRALLARLAEEGILLPGDGAARNAAVPDLPAGTFTAPVLQKYTEMQDLLTLDPIHEVDETGWPNRSHHGES